MCHVEIHLNDTQKELCTDTNIVDYFVQVQDAIKNHNIKLLKILQVQFIGFEKST